jgi:hypothetical protein
MASTTEGVGTRIAASARLVQGVGVDGSGTVLTDHHLLDGTSAPPWCSSSYRGSRVRQSATKTAAPSLRPCLTPRTHQPRSSRASFAELVIQSSSPAA